MAKKSLLLIPLVISITLIALLASFLIIPTIYPKSSIPKGQTYEIVLTDKGFVPDEIAIKHGDLIKFTATTGQPFWPASDLHPTHGIYPEFDPLEPIDPDKSWTFQFLKSGRWKFHDHLQPILRGTIVVQ